MNKEEVIRIAREVADKNKEDPVNSYSDMITLTPEELMRLIDRVQMQEREACIKIGDTVFINSYSRVYEVECTIKEYKEKIRARGGVKTDDKTCPHCGAMTDAEYPNKYYGCGTHINDPTHRFGTCYERQIEQQAAEIERLKQSVLDERDSFMQIINDPENQPTQYGTVTLEYMEREIAKEREACARVCDAEYNSYDEYDRERDGALFCADAIRARGEK